MYTLLFVNSAQQQKTYCKLTLGGHFLVSTSLSAILFSVQRADKFLPPEQITRVT